MGGALSGRWGWHRRKRRVESGLALDLGAVFAGRPPVPGDAGTIAWGPADRPTATIRFAVLDGPLLRLDYQRGADPTPVRLPVRLDRTAQTRGGGRWWGVCPLAVDGIPCGRRVAKLYLPPGERCFGCRGCHRLAYTSAQTWDRRVAAALRSGFADRLAAGPLPATVGGLGFALKVLDARLHQLDRVCHRLDRCRRLP